MASGIRHLQLESVRVSVRVVWLRCCLVGRQVRVQLRVKACLLRLRALSQFVAATNCLVCSLLRSCAAGFSLTSRTFNPKVAGSIPARPMKAISTFSSKNVEVAPTNSATSVL
jgi:hypothetical protein